MWRLLPDRRMALAALVAAAMLVAADGAVAQDFLKEARVRVGRPGEALLLMGDSVRLELTTRRVEVAARTDLEALLREQGIYPDGESFGAVYRLNPELRAPTVEAGTTVVLPRLSGPESVVAALTGGYFVYLTLDPVLKRSLARRVRGLRQAERAVREIPPERLGGAAAADEVSDAMRRLSDFGLAVGLALQERTRPANAEVLGAIDAELGAVAATLDPILQGGMLDQEGRARIVAAADQAEARGVYWTEAHGPGQDLRPYPRAWLEVEVLRDMARVPGFRVYYSSPALVGQEPPRPFGSLSSGTQPVRAELDVANYVVWAGRPDDPTPLTDRLAVELRSRAGGPAHAVQLVVVRP